MKKYILAIIIFLFADYFINAQNKITANAGYGYYLSNSENSLRIMGDKRYKSYFHFGFAFQRGDLVGLNLMLEYSYHQMEKEDALEFFITSSFDPEIQYKVASDASILSHNFDLDYIGSIGSYFSYGFGPSFVIINRIIEVNNAYTEAGLKSFYDKLASSGLGANAFFDFSVPFTEAREFFFITSKIKFRYIHSIWFDKGLRNLDDYKQEFLVFNFSVGIGYAF